MAEIFTDEGLDLMLGVFPKCTVTPPTSLYLGLFSSQTATTVPARTAAGGATPSGWTEVTGTGYARQEIPSTAWGNPSTNGNGRRITESAAERLTAGGSDWTAANGFFLATHATSEAGDVIIFFSNFASGVARQLSASGDYLDVTPSMQADG